MLKLSAITAAVGGRLTGNDVVFESVSIDSRTLEAGALFVPLRGERYDGHEFIAQAAGRGAVAIMAEREAPGGLPVLVVKDTTLALGKLAAFWRAQFSMPLIAVTGSNGKTTVKEMIASILERKGAVHASIGNFNNHIGLPLTLLGLGQNYRYGVLEMGMNHPGEIDYLARLAQPTVVAITNAASAHLEGLGDLVGVARGKAEAFHGLQPGGVAVINADDRFAAYWIARTHAFRTVTFGIDNRAEVSAQVTASGDSQVMEITLPDESFEFTLNLLGRHNAANALAAAAACWAVGCGAAEISKGLECITPVERRLQIKAGDRGACLIDDTYNANPASLRAAIRVLASRPGRHALVLGDMAELGERAEHFHYTAGRQAREAGIDHLLTTGPLARLAAEEFGASAWHFEAHEALINEARNLLTPGLTVLVKGSRSAHMETVADALTATQNHGAIAC
ncbi:MAG: UDP-N-acetylmuramoyl-tripeptide--D-alanyl-D-alanine ligase [Arenicellales bacterium]|jgi:UDP-N-acetylmuramoyl-tripeptide--D-alanyl-D-alanine ligase|nr:UDP-N-acetylmuramoyl-tripeptide--D-alanyl-D-alanine ligase [Arenicellales bacterium]